MSSLKIVECIRLIESGLLEKVVNSTWADLGCGSGLFAKALASLLGNGSKIYAVDKVQQSIESNFNKVVIEFIKADIFNEPLTLSNLDGVLMANSLHYMKDKSSFFKKIKKLLKPNGQVIVVEYEMEKANAWVPYPISFNELEKLFSGNDFGSVVKIGERISIFNAQKMYACSEKLFG